ncbi:MFS transporter [Streptomyces brevispora]|uniref:Putative MFS family arabinose efflux permease n=1 Tax=Streptomyces brevispora TaxID=887462 RepID=A0A561UWH4_9ACTN|nr:MFS transporter [Streptomyces brevispora]TWG03700.1 putative MFS family arabinose efflux permease [Streptomyces brevispora]
MSTYSVASTNFRRFWFGQTLSQFGTRVGTLALSVTAVDLLHADSQEVGLLGAASTVCYLLIGLPAGAWVDRMFKRRTMMWAALARALAVLVLPVLWFTGDLGMGALYAVALVVGVVTVFFDVGYQSYVPVLVPEEDIAPANARLESTAQVSTLAGPALAGLLMRVVSAPVVLLMDAFAYLASFLCLAVTEDGEQKSDLAPRTKGRLGADIAEGLRFVRDQPVIRRLAVSMGVSNFFATMVATLVPVLVMRTIGFDAFMLGLIMTCGAVGGVLGAMLAPRARQRYSVGTIMSVGLLTAAFFTAASPLAALAGDSDRVLAGTILLVGEFGLTVGALLYNVTQVSLRQKLCPKNLLGRMNASIRFVVWGSMPIAAIAAGWLGTAIGVVPTLWIGVAGSIATVLPIVTIDKVIAAGEERPAAVESVR